MASISASNLKAPVQPTFKAPEMPQSIKDLADKKPGTPGTTTPTAKEVKKPADTPKPTLAQEKAVDKAGEKAVAAYKTAIADSKKRADLAEAITGAKATTAEKEAVGKYLDGVAKSKNSPDFNVAAVGSKNEIAKGNDKKLGGEVLAKEVDGAYVAKLKTALISEKLLSDDGKPKQGLGAAVSEETGEWLAAGAKEAKLKVGDGDAGNRLALVLGGNKEEAQDDALNTNSKADKTTVRIGGKTFEAEAAAATPPAGQVYFRIANMVNDARVTYTLNGETKYAQENNVSTDFTHTTILVPRGYTGTFTTTGYDYNNNKSEQVTYQVSNLGTANQSVKSLTAGWNATSITTNDARGFYKVGIQTIVQQRGIWLAGLESGWKLTIPSAKGDRVVENDSAADWHKSQDYIATALPLGYDGTLKLTKDKTTVEVKVNNYGQKNQQISANTKGWSVVKENKETFWISSKETKEANRQALQNAANSFLDYTAAYATSIRSALPVGTSSAAMMSNFADNIGNIARDYSNESYGYTASLAKVTRALRAYRGMGATPAELKATLDRAAGSTPQNGNPPFTDAVTSRMNAITGNLTTLTKQFGVYVKEQKGWEAAQKKRDTINLFVNMAADVMEGGAILTGLGMIVKQAAKAPNLTTSFTNAMPSIIGQAVAAAGMVAYIGNKAGYFTTMNAIKTYTDESFREVLKTIDNQDDRASFTKLGDSNSAFFTAMLDAVKAGALNAKPDFSVSLDSYNYGKLGGRGQMTKEAILALAKAKLGLKNEDYLQVKWSDVSFGKSPGLKLDVWYRP